MARISVEERRKQLIQAAIAVISEKGVAAASIRAIADQAGAPLASVHYAFASRLALIQAVMEELIRESRDYSVSIPSLEGAGVREVIRTHLSGYVEMVRTHRDREIGMLELMLHVLRDPALGELAEELYRKYYEAAEEVAVSLAESSGFSWNASFSQVAHFIVLITDGLTLSYLSTSDDRLAGELIDLSTASLCALIEGPDQFELSRGTSSLEGSRR